MTRLFRTVERLLSEFSIICENPKSVCSACPIFQEPRWPCSALCPVSVPWAVSLDLHLQWSLPCSLGGWCVPLGRHPWAIHTGPCCGSLSSGVFHSHLASCFTITITRCVGNSSCSGGWGVITPHPEYSHLFFFKCNSFNVHCAFVICHTLYQFLRL